MTLPKMLQPALGQWSWIQGPPRSQPAPSCFLGSQGWFPPVGMGVQTEDQHMRRRGRKGCSHFLVTYDTVAANGRAWGPLSAVTFSFAFLSVLFKKKSVGVCGPHLAEVM